MRNRRGNRNVNEALSRELSKTINAQVVYQFEIYLAGRHPEGPRFLQRAEGSRVEGLRFRPREIPRSAGNAATLGMTPSKGNESSD